MKSLSKDNDEKFLRTLKRDIIKMLLISMVVAWGIFFTLFLAAKGIID